MKKRINIATIVYKMQRATRHLVELCSHNIRYSLLLAVANSSLFTLHSSLLMGCSSDDYEEQNKSTLGAIIPEVASYVTWYDEAVGTTRSLGADETYGTNGTTRAWTAPTGYMAYEDGIQPIGIAFTRDGEDPEVGADPSNQKSMIGSFFYSSEKWRTSLEDIQAATYYLYGYIPHLPAIRYSITDYNGGSTDAEKNADYSKGAIMKLENVPSVMSNDLCVAIGVKHGFDKEHDGDYTDVNNNGTYNEGTDTRTNRLRMGDFAYTAKATSGVDAKGNYVFLLFDHLYASLRIRMKIFADYAKLRTIKLKSLQLSTQVGETTSKNHNTITITLKATDGSTPTESPIKNITYEATGAVIGSDGEDGIEFWKSTSSDGETLTTDFQSFTGHFMPSGITTLILTSVYDVYDKKGNLIRENCKATNTMVLKDLLTEQTTTQRGKRYTVNMTVNPTYLYMLSDPDLDNPTVKVE